MPRIVSLRQRSVLSNLCLAMVSTLVALGLAEATLRLAAHRILSQGETLVMGEIFDTRDPLLGFSHVPNSSRLFVRGGAFLVEDRINGNGHRDDLLAPERQQGMRRVLVLGDSFMFGDGVAMHEAMPRRLEDLMSEVDVINAGVRAWDLGQELLYYKSRGRSYQPDLVLQAFFINDLTPERGLQIEYEDTGLPRSYRLRDGDAATPAPSAEGPWRWMSGKLRSHSMVYTLARSRLDRAWGRRKAAERGPRDHASETPYLHVFESSPGSVSQAAWNRAYLVLDDMRRQALADRARFAIVLIPAPWQLSPVEWDRWIEWLKVDPATFSRTKPQEMVLAWCVRTETPCLDLLDTLQLGERKKLYFLHDHHWTPEGHDVAARQVARFLGDNGLP